eukprot:scaffold21499_cov60-Attheya_sp.AAC.4
MFNFFVWIVLSFEFEFDFIWVQGSRIVIDVQHHLRQTRGIQNHMHSTPHHTTPGRRKDKKKLQEYHKMMEEKLKDIDEQLNNLE